MVEFMVLAAPRSGTTWTANWLTTDTTLCLHEPMWTKHYNELDAIQSKRVVGVSCTGLYRFPEWVNKHPARKVILHRPYEDIVKSSQDESLCNPKYTEMLNAIKGMHVHWEDIFNNPKPIYEFLLQKEFDEERHNELKLMQVNSAQDKIKMNPEHLRKLILELKANLC